MRDADLISRAVEPMMSGLRTNVLDALYCEFHNTAGTLEGNTEASDIEWFARRLWEADSESHIGWHWEQLLDEAERERRRRTARIVLRELPVLMGRMAHRLRDQAATIQTILKAERAARKPGAEVY